MRRLLKSKRAEEATPADDEEAVKTALEQEAAKKGKGKMPDDQAADSNDDEDPDEDGDDDGGDDENDEDDAKPKKGKSKASASANGADAADVAELCHLFGQPGLAAGFIRKGMNADAVRRHLLKLRNEDAETERIAGKAVVGAHTGGPAKRASLSDNMKNLLTQKGLIQ